MKCRVIYIYGQVWGVILCSSPGDRQQDTDLYIIILEY